MVIVYHFILCTLTKVGGAVASWLVRSTPERAVLVRALAGDIVLCSWARHFTLTVPLSAQVYKWVPANLMLGVTLRWSSIPSRGSRNTPSRFMLQKPGQAPAWWATIGSHGDFTYLPTLQRKKSVIVAKFGIS